jgi:lipopolysaccharide/colanic/teichoic acid biosynthesis glycosyltransferase
VNEPVEGLRYPARGTGAVLKRGLDIAGALFGLIVLSPVLALIAVLISLDSPGGVFHRRMVVGQHHARVAALKFRTMRPGRAVASSTPAGIQLAPGTVTHVNDPRVTGLGAFLRKTSLDELPQLWNVLKGEMSLVGPRMFTDAEYAALAAYPRWQAAVVLAKPAMTGLWQVSGRRQLPYAARVELDLAYLANWSIGLDLAILAKTIPAVIAQRGAF